MVKVIKSDADYEQALAEIERVLDREPTKGTPEAEELQLLTILVREYESSHFPVGVPNPLAAIKFRMEQQGLSQRDLVPFMGSRSKVSEVLSGRRPLTLSMMRALHSGLGIPATVLLRAKEGADFEGGGIQWDRFPLREMVARGWIEEDVEDYSAQAERVLRGFFLKAGTDVRPLPVLFRQSGHVRSARHMDDYALIAWTARATILARESGPGAEYRKESLDVRFMSELARLSLLEEGPLLAREFLAKYGIAFVVLPHLPRTYLDGAAILAEAGRPVVALTLRYDRIDNFWFCLMHELAHVALHLEKGAKQFLDDLDSGSLGDRREDEADQRASEALIPEEDWRKSPASRLRSPEAVQELARRLRIHPAIIAGRYRHQYRTYRVLNQFVGHGKVRCLFRDVKWS